jgi:hypothetical protein
MTPSALRTAMLRDALDATVDALHRRRASEIPIDYIEDYVALDWLEWSGGGLKLTTVGENIRLQLRTEAQGREGRARVAAPH